jgi:hypothetical protein
MTHQALRSVPAALPLLGAQSGAPSGEEGTWGDVGELIRHFCADGGRHGFRLAGRDAGPCPRSGHLFIEQGQVMHAEYGEDFGLNAVLQLLRAGPMRLEHWTGAWPRQRSLRLSPERLLAAPDRREASPPAHTGVVRKVTLPADLPSPLPAPTPRRPQAARTTLVRLSSRGLSSALSTERVLQTLQGVQGVQGVLGSFLSDRQGELLAHLSPPEFTEAVLRQTASRIGRIVRCAELCELAVQRCAVRLGGQQLIVFCCASGVLGVLVQPPVNTRALARAARLALRELGPLALGGTELEPDAEVTSLYRSSRRSAGDAS